MKKLIFGLNLILIFSFVAAAQNQKMQSNSEDENKIERYGHKQNSKNSTDSPAASDENSLIKAGTTIEAMLKSSLNAKKSKVGDEVILKTTKTIKQDGEVIVPKGTKLIGKITEVQEKSKSDATSKIGMVFERLEGKNFSAPINLSIVSITDSRSRATAPGLFETGANSGSRTAGSARQSSGGSGLLGGATTTVSGVLNTTTSTVGGVAGAATQTVGGSTQAVGRSLNGITITRSVSAGANGSSTLTAEGKDLRINKGATFNLLVNGGADN